MSPSKLHGFLAAGLPIVYVGPRGSNVDEAVRRFGCGVSLNRSEVGALLSFLRRLIAEPSTRSQLSTNSRAAFLSRYTDDVSLACFDELLAGLADGTVSHTSDQPLRSAA